jgi:diguanylate cyclase (GGDEF)-like protein
MPQKGVTVLFTLKKGSIMSVTTQERQLEDHRKLEKRQAVHFKYVLHSYFKNIASPGFVSDNVAIFGSYLAILVIFVLDVITDPVISFHLLYVFPVTFIALHSSRISWVTGAVVLSISLQVSELLFFQSRTLWNPVYLFLFIAFSNIICALVAKHSRDHTLEIKRLSTIDSLTQLCNRRGFDIAMKNEVMQQRRKGEHGSHFSLAVLDLDGFKGLNDSKGHKAGDEALILLSGVLRKLIRQTDTICRVGGDEFVVLMPSTEASDCHALCQLLNHTIRLKLTETFSYPLSVSIGFTTSDYLAGNFKDLLSIADKALYRAKALGKGCVVRGHAEGLTGKAKEKAR